MAQFRDMEHIREQETGYNKDLSLSIANCLVMTDLSKVSQSK